MIYTKKSNIVTQVLRLAVKKFHAGIREIFQRLLKGSIQNTVFP